MADGLEGAITDPAMRAALMVMILEDEQAASLLGKLDPEELQVLGTRMCALQDVQGNDLDSALASFMERLERSSISTHDHHQF